MVVHYNQDVADWMRTEDRSSYIKNGELYENESTGSVMIESESDLTLLTLDYVRPGAIAYTPGFAKVWQIGTDGVWREM